MKPFKTLRILTSVFGVLLLLIGSTAVYAADDDSDKAVCPSAENNENGKVAAYSVINSKGYKHSDGSLIKITDADSLSAEITKLRSETHPKGVNVENMISEINAAFEKGFNKCLESDDPSSEKNNLETCNKVNESWMETRKKFLEACGKAKGGSTVDVCLQNAEICGDIMAEPPPETDPDEKPKVTPDTGNAAMNFQECRSLAGEDLEFWQTAVEQAQTKVETLEDQIPEIQKEIADLESQYTARENKAKDDLINLETETEDKLDELKANNEEVEDGVEARIDEIRGLIDAENQKITQLRESMTSAYNTFQQAVSQLNLTCHAEAQRVTNQKRQAKQALIQTSQYSAGGFNNLFRSAGLSNKKASESMAEQYYRECQNDRAYSENKKAAERIYAQALRMSEQGISYIQKRINDLNGQIDKLKNEAPDRLKKYIDALEKLQKNYERNKNRIEQNAQTELMDLAKQKALAAENLNRTSLRLQEAQSELEQKKAYLAVKMQYSDGTNQEQGAAADFVAQSINFLEDAKSVVQSCSEVNTKLCKEALPHATREGGSTYQCPDRDNENAEGTNTPTSQ